MNHRSIQINARFGSLLVATVLLSACGGGGSDNPIVSANPSAPESPNLPGSPPPAASPAPDLAPPPASGQGGHLAKTVHSSSSGSVVLRENGELWGWGSDNNCVLATPNDVETRPVLLGTDFASLITEVPDRQVFAIKTNGDLYTWGAGGYSLGTGNTADLCDRNHKLLSGVKLVSSGGPTSAVMNDGSVMRWGHSVLDPATNRLRQVTTPEPYMAAGGVVDAAENDTVVAMIRSDGTLWTVGENSQSSGLLGIGPPERDMSNINNGNNGWQSGVFQVGTATNWQQISRGQRIFYASNAAGEVWAWGHNQLGFLGDGTSGIPSSKWAPVKVMDAGSAIVKLEGGYSPVTVIRADGSLWSWGPGVESNPAIPGVYGPNVTIVSETRPQQILPSDVKDISIGVGTGPGGVYIKTNGDLWAWGYNNSSSNALNCVACPTGNLSRGTTMHVSITGAVLSDSFSQ